MPTPAELTAIMVHDRTMLAATLDGNHANARTRKTNIFQRILAREIETGSMFLVAQPEALPFLFVGISQEIISIPRAGKGGDRFWAYMHGRYGCDGSEDYSKGILASFRTYAFKEGAHVEMRRFACYHTASQTAHISGYNGSQWKVDGENIIPIANGEDDVFFIDDDGGAPIVPEIGPNGVLFETLIDPISFAEAGIGGITALQMKRALIIWMFGLAFPDLMPTKPLLIVEGAPGSGKSACLQLIQTALLGKRKPIVLSATRPDDFGVILLRSPICVFDNLDSYIDWLPDAVCSYTTQGVFTRRKLFTDAEELNLRPHAFIAVASKNPSSFRREDTADRLIIMRLERRDSAGLAFTRMGALDEQIQNLRPQLFGEYLYYVNRLVAEIRAGALTELHDEKFRMGDFAALARLVSKILEWEDTAVEELLVAIQCEQGAFHNEADPTADLLNKWLAQKYGGKSNVGRTIDIHQLFLEMESIAQGYSIQFYKQPVLLQKLRSPHIERDFQIVNTFVNGIRHYQIWRRGTPQLISIPMPSTPESMAGPVDEADEG